MKADKQNIKGKIDGKKRENNNNKKQNTIKHNNRQTVKSEINRESLKSSVVSIVIYTFLAHRKQWWSCKKMYSYLARCHAHKPEASLRELMGNDTFPKKEEKNLLAI